MFFVCNPPSMKDTPDALRTCLLSRHAALHLVVVPTPLTRRPPPRYTVPEPKTVPPGAVRPDEEGGGVGLGAVFEEELEMEGAAEAEAGGGGRGPAGGRQHKGVGGKSTGRAKKR